MPSCTSNAINSVMALNAFCPQFDPESIPPYNDWVANTTFDPFGPEPVAAVHGSSDMTRNFSQEVSSDPSTRRELNTNEIHHRDPGLHSHRNGSNAPSM